MIVRPLLATSLLLTVVALAPPANAHAVVDVYLIPTFPAAPIVFLPITEGPSHFLDPVTSSDITGNQVLGLTVGTGSCNVIGEACLAWPVWNPSLAGPVRYWQCEHTGGTVPPGTPGLNVHLVQSADDILGNAGDIVYTMVFPVGPLIGGVSSSDAFFPFGLIGGGFQPGMHLHVVPFFNNTLAVPPNDLDVVVTCWVL